jgi:hypothetical protein
VASKHWTCRHAIDRQGRSIRSVERGHLSDNVVAVVTISGSRDLLITIILSVEYSDQRNKTPTVIDNRFLGYSSTAL